MVCLLGILVCMRFVYTCFVCFLCILVLYAGFVCILVLQAFLLYTKRSRGKAACAWGEGLGKGGSGGVEWGNEDWASTAVVHSGVGFGIEGVG